jgi:glycerol-3-phosphate dehydrogenase
MNDHINTEVYMNRNSMLSQLAEEGFDLLVIGGGITGAGVAREASIRGLRVALVEGRDFAHATSSRSTKLIHGGVRYLKNFEFRLVRESVQERQRLLKMAPHLVQATPFLFPVYQGDPDGLFKMHLGLTLYDWFAGKTVPIPHQMHGATAILAHEPLMQADGLKGGAIYCDSRTDDGRLTLEVIASAIQHGAVAANYVEVKRFLKNGGGQITGAVCEDRLTGNLIEVRASKVLAAAGPYADLVRQLDDPGAPVLLRPTKGVHLTLPHHRLPVQHAVVMRGHDGRMMFAVPSGDCTYVGTTDTDYQGDSEAMTIDRSDVEYIIEATRHSFPSADITESDVIGGWAGLRPLLKPQNEKKPSATSRDYSLFRSPSGLVSVGGGKLTAFRAMASHILDDLFPSTRGNQQHLALSTAPLPGAVGQLLTDAEVTLLAVETGGDQRMIERLAKSYGSAIHQVTEAVRAIRRTEPDADRAWLRARTQHAVRHEMAVRLEDVIKRRTDLMLFTRGNGLPHLEILADEMTGLLGWTATRREQEIDQCRQAIRAMFAWKAESADANSHIR